MKKFIGGRARLAVFTLLLLIVSVVCLFLSKSPVNNYTEEANNDPDNDGLPDEVVAEATTGPVTKPVQVPEEEEPVEALPLEVPLAKSPYNLTDEEVELLAKIAMAEAEGEDMEGKALVICVVLNRVADPHFPNTIREVIFQNNGKTYQFSPVKAGGRWWTTTPNEDCYKAVEMVLGGWDNSKGATYFTSQKQESTWHSRSLTFLFQHGCHKFYVD